MHDQPTWLRILADIALIPTAAGIAWTTYRLETGNQFISLWERSKAACMVLLVVMYPMSLEMYRLWAKAFNFIMSGWPEWTHLFFMMFMGVSSAYIWQVYFFAFRDRRIPRITNRWRLFPLVVFSGLMSLLFIYFHSKMHPS